METLLTAIVLVIVFMGAFALMKSGGDTRRPRQRWTTQSPPKGQNDNFPVEKNPQKSFEFLKKHRSKILWSLAACLVLGVLLAFVPSIIGGHGKATETGTALGATDWTQGFEQYVIYGAVLLFLLLAVSGKRFNAHPAFANLFGFVIAIMFLMVIVLGVEKTKNLLFGNYFAEWQSHKKKNEQIAQGTVAYKSCAARQDKIEKVTINDPYNTNVITLKGDVWTVIRVHGMGGCVRWWSENPIEDVFDTCVMGVNDGHWTAWEEWKDTRSGADFGWISFKSNTGGDTVAYLTFKDRDQCN